LAVDEGLRISPNSFKTWLFLRKRVGVESKLKRSFNEMRVSR
jgi:hypothetical protein